MHISTSHAVESQAPAASQARDAQSTPPTRAAEREANPNAEDSRPSKSVNPAGEAERLSEADLRQVQQLKTRDREVRAHEQAHLAAGGSLTRGGASYTYEKGPDGKRYAVSGEVQIDTARVPGDPEATAQRAEQVRRAATAPTSPSAQDRAVAAEAAALANRARAEARAEAREEVQATTDSRADESAVAGENEAVTTLGQASDESPSRPTEGESDGVDTPANSSLSLYESVAAIEDGQAPSTSIFEPVVT